MHLLDDLDLVNAKYLHKRCPELVTKRSKIYQQVFSAIEPLEHYAFDKALDILGKPLAPPTSVAKDAKADTAKASDGEDLANRLREVLVWHLQMNIVPKFIRQSYSTVKTENMKKMLGNVKDASVLQQLGFSSASTDFVKVASQQAVEHQFSITETKVQEMTQIVRFLE